MGGGAAAAAAEARAAAAASSSGLGVRQGVATPRRRAPSPAGVSLSPGRGPGGDAGRRSDSFPGLVSKTQSGSSLPAPTRSSWQVTTTRAGRPEAAGSARRKRDTPAATRCAVARSNSEVNSSRTSAGVRASGHMGRESASGLRPCARAARARATSARLCSPLDSWACGAVAVLVESAAAESAAVAASGLWKCDSTDPWPHSARAGIPSQKRAKLDLPLPAGPTITPSEPGTVSWTLGAASPAPAPMGAMLGMRCVHSPSNGSSNSDSAYSMPSASEASGLPT
mmetsp:Transcript_106069/g.287869  ORF Transcript_106069/g.287869 Transcript_106069/m.287869 type:complete len:283 (-) Transcript_106069:1109-1957(-)